MEIKIFIFFFQKSPPYIFSPIPFLGHAIAFGKSPIEFLENAYEKVRLLNKSGETSLEKCFSLNRNALDKYCSLPAYWHY